MAYSYYGCGEGETPAPTGQCGPSVWVMKDDGSARRQVARAVPHERMAGVWWGHTEPALSPTGRFIATARTSPDGTRLYVMTADGETVRRVSPPFPASDEGNGNSQHDRDPAWSPDERKLVFASNRPGWDPSGPPQQDIYTLDLATGKLTRLTDDGRAKGYPSFSPDGENIVFEYSEPQGPGGYMINADGTDPQPLAKANTLVGDITYSPDGERLAFRTWAGLFVMDVGGGDPRQVVENRLDWSSGIGTGWAALNLTFAEGGRSLLFVGIDSGFMPSAALYKVAVDGPLVEPTRLTDYGDYAGISWAGASPDPARVEEEDDAPPELELIDTLTGETSVTVAQSAGRVARTRTFAVKRARLGYVGVDGSGVGRLSAAIAYRNPKERGCRFLRANGFGQPRSCRAPRYFSITSAGRWQAHTDRLRAGRRYRVWLKARDSDGRVTRRPAPINLRVTR
jgi:Tol biopolymer transport system component